MYTLSKLIVCAVMLRGRHRGLPVALDRAVLLPTEFLPQTQTQTQTQTPAPPEKATEERASPGPSETDVPAPLPARAPAQDPEALRARMRMRTRTISLVVEERRESMAHGRRGSLADGSAV